MHISVSVVLFVMFAITYAQYMGNLKAYKIYSFDTDDKICSQSVKRKIEFSRNKSAIFIHQSRLNDHAMHWKYNFECKFQIDATPFDVSTLVGQYFFKGIRDEKNLGLFAVIQNIEFRQDPITGECIDYVKFRHKGGLYGPQVCGKHNIALVMESEGETDKESRLSFSSDNGVIEVYIFVNKQQLVAWENIDLKIVFTAFKKCGPNTLDFCGSRNMKKCIPIEYFGDGIINCPYSKCSDETDCMSVYRNLMNENPLEPCMDGNLQDCYVSPTGGRSTNTKVTAGAVATLLLSFVVFVLCVWICKKYSKLCFAEDCANPPNRNNQSSRTIELENRQESSVPTITPTAPSIDENKDLPPSYDSLFPTR